MLLEKTFTASLPCSLDLKKSDDGEWPTRINIEAIGATQDLDQANEIILLKGMDIRLLNATGLMNWDHGLKDKPGALMGEVEQAWFEPNPANPEKVMVKGFLYGHYPPVQELISVLEAQKAAKGNRPLCVSIEGKILARDDSNRITKSLAHSVALTFLPVNKKCMVLNYGPDVEKSLNAGWCNSPDESDCHNTSCCASCGCGGSCGGECTCKKPTSIEKALSAGYGDSPETQTGGSALRPEHLEGAEDFHCPSCHTKIRKAKSGLHIVAPTLVKSETSEASEPKYDRVQAYKYVKEQRPDWTDDLINRFLILHELKLNQKLNF